MSRNNDRVDGNGSGGQPFYPLTWWESGVNYFYDGSDEHISYGRAAPRDNNAFTIHCAPGTPDAECAALAVKWKCNVVRDAK